MNHPHVGRRGGMSTDLRVGESLLLRARHGTGEVRFSLEAKDIDRFLTAAAVDLVHIHLTIHRRDGQRAKVVVRADEAVKVERPQRKLPEPAA